MAKKPKFGMYVHHHVPVGPGYDHIGLVDGTQLSTQFVLVREDGGRHIVGYSEDWSIVAKRSSNQQFTVEAPSVWRDHQSRTCIVLDVTDEDVQFIPMIVDDPYRIETESMKAFCQMYMEPIDYPVSRAARLFVEYARNTGATDEVLDALSPFTTISEEEKEMARKKAATEKAAAKKPAAKKTPAKAKGDSKPKESAASVYRDSIMAGKSQAQVIAAVNKKFPGKGNESYVRWYFNDLKKKGQNPPTPKGMAESSGRGRPKKEK